MALPGGIEDRERLKFEEDSDGKVALRTINAGGAIDFKWDAFTVTSPTSESTLYSFTLDGVAVGSVTLTYSDSTKSELIGGSRVRL